MTGGYTETEREFSELSLRIEQLREARGDLLAEARFGTTDGGRRKAAQEAELLLLEIGGLIRRRAEIEPQYRKDRDARFARDLEADSDKDAG